MMKTYKYLLKHSTFSRVILAILVGIFSKIISLPLFILYFFGSKLFAGNHTGIYDAVASRIETHAGAIDQAFSILVVAPILENLIIPLIFWVCFYFHKKPFLPIFIITILAYFYHQAGTPRLTGAIFFFCYASFYEQCRLVVSGKQSYALTVIAHFVTNLIAIAFMMNPIV